MVPSMADPPNATKMGLKKKIPNRGIKAASQANVWLIGCCRGSEISPLSIFLTPVSLLTSWSLMIVWLRRISRSNKASRSVEFSSWALTFIAKAKALSDLPTAKSESISDNLESTCPEKVSDCCWHFGGSGFNGTGWSSLSKQNLHLMA